MHESRNVQELNDKIMHFWSIYCVVGASFVWTDIVCSLRKMLVIFIFFLWDWKWTHRRYELDSLVITRQECLLVNTLWSVRQRSRPDMGVVIRCLRGNALAGRGDSVWDQAIEKLLSVKLSFDYLIPLFPLNSFVPAQYAARFTQQASNNIAIVYRTRPCINPETFV